MVNKFEEYCVAAFVIVGSFAIGGYFFSIMTGSKEAEVQITEANLVSTSEIGLFPSSATSEIGTFSSTPKSDNSNVYSFESFIVVFGYFEDKNLIRIPCIGAYIGNSSVIATDGCLGPYRKLKITAILGLLTNETETFSIEGHKRHHDYVTQNKTDSDIIMFKLKQNVRSHHPIELEAIANRTLNFYTTPLYRITIDQNYESTKESVTTENIKDCGHQVYCLELGKSEKIIGSLLVAEQNNKYVLLGMEQNRTIGNNLATYTKISLHVSWIEQS